MTNLLQTDSTSCTPEDWGIPVICQHRQDLLLNNYPKPQGNPAQSVQCFINRHIYRTDQYSTLPYQFDTRDIPRILPPWVDTLPALAFHTVVSLSAIRSRRGRINSILLHKAGKASPMQVQQSTPNSNAYWDWRESQLRDYAIRNEQGRIAAFTRNQAREAVIASLAPPAIRGKGSRETLRAMRTINTPNLIVIDNPQAARLRIAKGTITNPRFDSISLSDIESAMQGVDSDMAIEQNRLDTLIREYQDRTRSSELDQWIVFGSQPEHGTLRPLTVKHSAVTRKQAEYLAGRVHVNQTGTRTSVIHRSLNGQTVTEFEHGK